MGLCLEGTFILPVPHKMRSQSEHLMAAWETLLLTLGAPPSETLPERNVTKRNQGARGTKIPVTVLSGFLGSGKTTLLQQLLQNSSTEIVAIVNDIASINVDAALIRSTNAETIELQNGCVCCVLGSDLFDSLRNIGLRSKWPDAIVIESSGLSDPMGIAQTVANVDTMSLDGIVTVVDALSFRERIADPVTAMLFERQLAAAHLIVLTKTATRKDADLLIETLAEMVPGRRVIVSDLLMGNDGELANDLLLGASTQGARLPLGGSTHDYDGFSVETVDRPEPIRARIFFSLLDQIPDSVYRMKGGVRVREESRELEHVETYSVQAAGAHWRVVRQPTEGELDRLIVIGRRNDPALESFVLKLRE